MYTILIPENVVLAHGTPSMNDVLILGSYESTILVNQRVFGMMMVFSSYFLSFLHKGSVTAVMALENNQPSELLKLKK